MEREDFFGKAIDGSIRKEVADKLLPLIMEKVKIKKDVYFEVEDIICEFLEEQSEFIFRFKDMEYMKEDMQSYLEEKGYFEFPDSLLTRIAQAYDDYLGDSDMYSDARYNASECAIIEFSEELSKYRKDYDEVGCDSDVPQDDEDVIPDYLDEDNEGPDSPLRKTLQCETCSYYYDICAGSGRQCCQTDGSCEQGNKEYWALVDADRKKEDE